MTRTDAMPHIVVENGHGSKLRVPLYSPEGLALLSELWTKVGFQYRQMYEPTWLEVPIIQFPGNMVMLTELVWKLKPDLIIETGVTLGARRSCSPS
jgi:hypothetical protein